jgi:hypothetical protein
MQLCTYINNQIYGLDVVVSVVLASSPSLKQMNFKGTVQRDGSGRN